jgi:AcrR family transcriptional regulator
METGLTTHGHSPHDPYHHGDLRNALLRAARQMLEERGPAGLGLREIARRVGVSAPSAYHHFRNLEAIASGLVEQGSAEFSAALRDAAGQPNMLLRTGEAYVTFARANPALYRLMFGEGLSIDVRNSQAMKALRGDALQIIKSRLPEDFSPDRQTVVALYLWSLVHGLALLVIDGHFDGPLPRNAIQQIIGLGGSGLASAGAARAERRNVR